MANPTRTEGAGLETVVVAQRTEPEASPDFPEAQTVERIVLTLEPARLPKVEVTDEKGVKRYKTVGLADLLGMLDESAVLEALKREAVRTTSTPELPEGTMFTGAIETPQRTDYVATGWLPPRNQPFVWQGRSYLIRMPLLVWSARWRESERVLEDLRVAVAAPGVEEAKADTRLYRWPFANVYAGEPYAKVCWYTMDEVELDFRDIVRLGVEGFLSVKDNGDLFGVGNSQNSPHRDYAEFLEAVEAGGLPEEWLIPHQAHDGRHVDVEKFHEAIF